MNEIRCKNCGETVIQTPGKREKLFCDTTCRSNYWQKEQRKKAVKPASKTEGKATEPKEQSRSYGGYKEWVREARSVEECEFISNEADKDPFLPDWCKREVKKLAIAQSQKIDL